MDSDVGLPMVGAGQEVGCGLAPRRRVGVAQGAGVRSRVGAGPGVQVGQGMGVWVRSAGRVGMGNIVGAGTGVPLGAGVRIGRVAAADVGEASPPSVGDPRGRGRPTVRLPAGTVGADPVRPRSSEREGIGVPSLVGIGERPGTAVRKAGGVG